MPPPVFNVPKPASSGPPKFSVPSLPKPPMALNLDAEAERIFALPGEQFKHPLLVPVKPPAAIPAPPRFTGALKPLPPRPEPETREVNGYQMPMRDKYLPEWAAILREVGYPTDVVVLDFETYFDDEYKMAGKGEGLSTIEYVTDERFEPTCLAVLMMSRSQPFLDYEQATKVWVGEAEVQGIIDHLKDKYGEDLHRCTVVIQNAGFDATVLAQRYKLRPKYLIDLLGLARHWHSRRNNDLGSLAHHYGLKEKGDTEAFKALTFRERWAKAKGRGKGPKLPVLRPTATTEQVQALCEYAGNDVCREWELFTLLLPKLSNRRDELRCMRHTLDLFLEPVLMVDFAFGEDLIGKMQAELDAAIAKTGHTREEISGDKSFEIILVDALTRAGDEPRRYFKPGKKRDLLAIAKTDDERELLATHQSEEVRTLMAARAANDSWPNHIKRVQRIMAQCRPLGKLPVPLKYCGAHTGRWSGGEKINLQNLGERQGGLIAAIRELIVAMEGYVLVITDASQIEARVLAWIAGQWDLVEKFAKNEEIYCGFATRVLGWEVRKPKKEGSPGYIPAIEGRYKWARNSIGKIGVLGCGYGMGADKAVAYAQGEIDLETAQKIVKVYRDENKSITQFWRDIERAFVYTAKYKKPCTMPRGLRFDSREDCDVVITLPNGRELKYHQVRIEPGQYGDSIRLYNSMERSWEYIWGGHLTENVVQAMSRDILWEAVARIEDRGYHVALHVHDEAVCHVPEEKGKACLAAMVEEIGRRPKWAPDCPLGAEGVIKRKYGGH